MADTHVTVVQQTTFVSVSRPYWDLGFIYTRSGILKIVQLVLDLIVFFCLLPQKDHDAIHISLVFFKSVTMFAFWITLMLLVYYLFHVISWFSKVPWMKIEFFLCAIWTLLYLIASITSLAIASKTDDTLPAKVAGAFGFFAAAVYGLDAFFKLAGCQAGERSQED